MDGKQFVSVLKEFGVQVGAVTESQWKKKADVTPAIFKNALHKFYHQKLSGAVIPIVEFHRLNLYHGNNLDTFAKRIHNDSVVKSLQGAVGVYAFFGAQGRLVYVGKTQKNNLMQEMTQRYGGKKVPFRVLKDGKAKWEPASIKDVALYFSAYKIDDYLIGNVEALLTRIIINNASNLKTESFT